MNLPKTPKPCYHFIRFRSLNNNNQDTSPCYIFSIRTPKASSFCLKASSFGAREAFGLAGLVVAGLRTLASKQKLIRFAADSLNLSNNQNMKNSTNTQNPSTMDNPLSQRAFENFNLRDVTLNSLEAEQVYQAISGLNAIVDILRNDAFERSFENPDEYAPLSDRMVQGLFAGAQCLGNVIQRNIANAHEKLSS